ncbi:MAG: hypothetical protein CMJ78_20310 [Planctomycetaceae bacterium]|nr:hypothetical protein [Planctomycetaceae bacterium]
MLRILDGQSSGSRRELLTAGGLALGGLTLESLLSAKLQAGANGDSGISGKSVIFVFQQGGPTQHETFDPKIDAPQAVRTVTDCIQTSIPGVLFGEAMPKLAKLADRLTIVRSFQTNNGGHNIQPIVSKDSLEANIGVHYSRVVGATRPRTGMPTNAVLFPRAVAPDVARPSARGNLSATGDWGSAYAPFTPGGGGQLQKNMELKLAREKFDDRRELLSQLDRLNQLAQDTTYASVSEIQDQAYSVLLGGGIGRALDLTQEDAATIERYDTLPYVKSHNWDKSNRGRAGMYTGQAKTIGKLLLLARRLCEAGCGFVTVHAGYAGVWDMHADRNNLNIVDGMQAVGLSFDHAVAAFIEDIEARGLQDEIMLVACGEMGRTPRINSRGGRDHWSRLAPLLIYGGGTSGGQVIGQSTRDGAEPAADNLTPENLISTIMHTVFDIAELRLQPEVPSKLLALSDPPPIV